MLAEEVVAAADVVRVDVARVVLVRWVVGAAGVVGWEPLPLPQVKGRCGEGGISARYEEEKLVGDGDWVGDTR